jgi:hypothetical protein
MIRAHAFHVGAVKPTSESEKKPPRQPTGSKAVTRICETSQLAAHLGRFTHREYTCGALTYSLGPQITDEISTGSTWRSPSILVAFGLPVVLGRTATLKNSNSPSRLSK